MSVTIPPGAEPSAGTAPAGFRPAAGSVAPQPAGVVTPTGPTPAVVYLAAAQNTYGTMLYRTALRRLAETWPGAVLMDADACGFASRADWQLRWPFIREGIDGLVVLCEGDGAVSHDTWLELRDAGDLGLPAWLVTGEGSFTPVTVADFRPYPTGTRSDRRWARTEIPSQD